MLILACAVQSLTWNQKGQLTHVSGAAAGPIEYRYDALGRRVAKIVNGVTTKYLYDGLNLIAELDGSDNVIAWYVYAGLDKPLARIAADGTVHYYHADILGSIIALTDASGNVTTQYNYSPFGQTEVIGTDIDQPFRFTGREYDAETDFYYYRVRTYSWKTRRFISEDPLRFGAGDVNWYAYVGGNPVNFTDPLGLESYPDNGNWAGLGGGGIGLPGSGQKDWCGSKGSEWVPDFPLGVDAQSACEAHDNCYSSDTTRKMCDVSLANDLFNDCISQGHNPSKCLFVAQIYHIGVALGGKNAYQDAQALTPSPVNIKSCQ